MSAQALLARVAMGLSLLPGWACSYDYPRTLKDGEIQATILDQDGKPAPTALVRLPGTERLASAGKDGKLSILDLPAMDGVLHIVLDDDGDGVAEQGALLPFHTELKPVRKNLSDGITTEPKTVVTGLILGEVRLDGARTLSGTVREEGAALAASRVAQVLAFHEVKLGAGDSKHDVALPVDASVAAAADGSFTLRGVLPGTVHVVALVRDDGGDADAFTTKVLELDDDLADVTLDVTDALSGAVPVQVDLFGQADRDTLDAVTFLRTDTGAQQGEPLSPGASEASQVLDAPRGVFDVQFQMGGNVGVLHGVVVVDDLPPWVPVEIPTKADPCAEGGKRDCDRDGLEGLPLFAEDPVAYAACRPNCSGLVGDALDGARCGGIDCDDDADGVADVDEASCAGPLLGTDADSDGVCEPAGDAFPLCSRNTVADCL